VLASALLEHHRDVMPEDTLETRASKLRMHLNRDALPIAWVAHSEAGVAGIAALRVNNLERREDLTPWLGGVYLLSEHRGRGVCTTLCATVEQKAASLGVHTLYLFTIDRQAWYANMGWRLFAYCSWRGQQGDIMQKQRDAA